MVHKDLWYYVAAGIGIALTFGFGHLPPFEPLTPIGMKVLGIFLGMIWLWSSVSILWPSLMGLIALIVSGYAPLADILKMSFGETVPILILFAMVLFGAIQHSGVTRYISRWFLTRKIINGKPVMFSFVFMYATYVLAALSANILPVLLFMWATLYGVLKDAGYKKGDKYTAIMVIGTMFAAISGQAAKPFTGSALLITGAYEKIALAQVNYLQYMVFGFIMSTLGIMAYALLIKFAFRPDMSKIQDINIERFNREKLPPMDTRQKIMLVSLFGYLILVLLPSILPKTLPGVEFLAKLGPLGVVIVFIAVLSFFKLEGKPIINFGEIAGKYVIWDVVFLVYTVMALASAMTSSQTGISEFLLTLFSPALGGHSPLIFMVVLIILGLSLVQVSSNGLTGVLLMPVVKVFSEQAGVSFEAAATLLIFVLHISILTPAGSPYAAILYENKAWVSKQEVLKYGFAICVLTIILFIVVGIPCMNLIY